MWAITILAVLCLALMLICNQIVVNNAEGKVFSEIDSIKYNNVGLLLGTTPQARFDRITNYFFIYRIDAAEQLYKAGKIEKILISGDEDSLDGVNETECMKDSLVARGVPASAIVLDGKGYRTISSIINANKVYGLKSFTIISQKFHNERAIYQAEHLGLDIEHVQAYNAKIPKSRRAFLTTIREYFARVKMFWDVHTYKESESNYEKKSVWTLNDLGIMQDTIYSFLGKPLIIDDSVFTHISAIADQDTMLSYSNRILQIGDVSWRIKFNPFDMILTSSTTADAPSMHEVIKYLKSIYGEPWTIEKRPFEYHWSFSDNLITWVWLWSKYPKEEGTILSFKIGNKPHHWCATGMAYEMTKEWP